jgi:hypothetical protein
MKIFKTSRDYWPFPLTAWLGAPVSFHSYLRPLPEFLGVLPKLKRILTAVKFSAKPRVLFNTKPSKGKAVADHTKYVNFSTHFWTTILHKKGERCLRPKSGRSTIVDILIHHFIVKRVLKQSTISQDCIEYFIIIFLCSYHSQRQLLSP